MDVSYLIALNFEKLGIRYKFAIADDNFFKAVPKSLPMRKSIKNRDGSYTFSETCNHYYLKVGNTVINPTGWHDNRDTAFIGCINSNDIKYLYDNGSWNDCFKKGNKVIVKRIINSIFKDYEKEN